MAKRTNRVAWGLTAILQRLIRRLGWGGMGTVIGAVPSAVVEWHFRVAPEYAYPQWCGTGIVIAVDHAIRVVLLGAVVGAVAGKAAERLGLKLPRQPR